MTRRQIGYIALTLAIGYLLMFAGVAGYVDYVNREQNRAEERAAAARAAQGEQTRQTVCRLANGYAQAFRDNPPEQPSQVTIRDTWRDLAVQFHCT